MGLEAALQAIAEIGVALAGLEFLAFASSEKDQTG